jgi:hypothetical protein
MSLKLTIPFVIAIHISGAAAAQCPTNEADLANGGTFSGNCTVNVGGSITVTGAIIWTSGTLTIQDTGGGGDGDMHINSGGSLTVQGGTVAMDDGDITINTGASLTIDGGASVEVLDNNREVYVDGGTLTVNGNLDIDRDLEAYNSGTVIVGNGGSITTDDDFDISGGATVTVQTGGTINLADDLDVIGNSNFTIESGASVTLGDEMFIDDSDVTVSGTLESTQSDDINIDGTSNVTFNEGANVTFNDLEAGTGDGAATVTINGGIVNIEGEVDFNNGTDGDAIVINGGTLEVGNDLEIGTTDGTITVNSGGTLNTPFVDGVAVTDPDDLPNNIVITGGDVNVNGVTLPVELISFSGKLNSGIITLNWETATELNNQRFDVQKSLDGENYITIGSIEGQGTTTLRSKYQYTDLQSSKGIFYYRLIQYDFDGQFEILPTISIANTTMTTVSRMNIYPNPVIENELTLTLEGEIILNDWQMTIYDLKGQLILQESGTAGSPQIRLENVQSRVQPGTYFVKVAGPAGSVSKRIIVQ